MTDPIPIKDLLPELLATIEAAHEAASSMSGTERPSGGCGKTHRTDANAPEAQRPTQAPAVPPEPRTALSPGRITCERCGRHLDRREGRIGDLNYCHPDDPALPDCYTITSHEQTFGRTFETGQDLIAFVDQRIIDTQIKNWLEVLENLAPYDTPKDTP